MRLNSTRRILLLTTILTAALVQSGRAGTTGACCFGDFCWYLTESECQTEGGTYLGDDTDCNDCPSPCPSGVPDPSKCTVAPADALNGLFVCPVAPVPVAASANRIVVRDNCGDPIASASVTVTLSERNPACNGTVLSGTTNDAGEVVLNLPASGCSHDVPLSGIIKANGLTIRSYSNVKSPDYDADGRVALPDLQQFAREFLGQTPDRCHDYDNDGQTRLQDLVLFSAAFSNANHCAP